MKESRRQAINFRLPPAVLTALRKRAKRDRVSMTGLVEAVLSGFLGVPSYGERARPSGVPIEQLTRMIIDLTSGRPVRVATPELKRIRKLLRQDIAGIHKRGGMVWIPAE